MLVLIVLAVISSTRFLRLTKAITVSIPLAAPANAPTLDPALLSFSLEQDRWTDWAGTGSPNSFFVNVLDNLAQRTGQTPWIRIGADSEDHTNFNSHIQLSQTIFPAVTTTVPYPEASNITVGHGFYSLASHLPTGTRVIWGVNFGQDNLTAAFLEAEAIKDAFDSSAVRDAGVTLEFIEIGNEADLYKNNGLRKSSTWTIKEYVKEWTNFAKNVSATAGIGSGSGPKFIGAAFAESSHSTSSFSPQGAFANGLLESEPGSLITTISQHHYSGSFCSGSGGLLQDLMTKSTIRSNLSSFSPDISAVHAKGLDYILGETNSYSCHGAPGVSNTAGAALWTLDYTLFASQIGIKRLHFHEGIGYKYNLIQPLALNRSIIDGSALAKPLGTHVQPQYYAALIVAEAIGSSSTAKASELDIDDSKLAGYAFFEGDDLKRAVIINSQAYLSSNTGKRSSKNVTFTFSGGGASPTTMTIKRLAIGHADDSNGLKWGGQSFETSDGRPNGTLLVQTVDVDAGVSITETEAVLLSFQ